MANDNFHFTTTSKKKVEEVKKELEKKLKEEGFGVLWSFEVHKKLAEKGLKTNKNITILEVCNPNEASNILEIDPMAGYILPCKIILTEEENETKVGLLSPKVLIGFLENQQLNTIAEEIEKRLSEAIKGAI